LREKGVALLMGLVLLAAISLLALTSTSGMLLQRHMSANFLEKSIALGHATRASSAAQAWLNSRTSSEREAQCTQACLLPTAILNAGELPDHPEWQGRAWWGERATAVGSHPGTGEPLDSAAALNNPPRWIMEEVHYEPWLDNGSEERITGIGYYRIFAWGSGENRGSVAVTESIVARPWTGDETIAPAPYPPDGQTANFCRQFDTAVPCGILAWRQRR
jgi:Tfp pilus assembly protein PilX